MPENDIREIPKHDIHVKADTKEKSLMRDIGKDVMKEIVVPKSLEVLRDMFTGVVNMFADAARNGIDKFLYPDGDVPTRRQNGNGSYTGVTNYTSFSKPIGTYQPSNAPVKTVLGQRPGNDVKYVWVDSEEKAKQIIGALKEDIQKYQKAKVASLYEMIGEPTTFADFKYGWVNENDLGYYYDTNRRSNEARWFLDLSKPVDITNV